MKGFENVVVEVKQEAETPIMMSVEKCANVPTRVKLIGGKTMDTAGGKMYCFDVVDDEGVKNKMWTFERDLQILLKDWGENIGNWPDGWVSFKKNLSGTRWLPYPSQNQHTEEAI